MLEIKMKFIDFVTLKFSHKNPDWIQWPKYSCVKIA
jgi:hypothetical protein